jgi:hypothetical protein
MSTETLPQRVYSNYRSALKATTAQRAGARKQKAREITSERYHVPISAVKSIVNEFDIKNGVAHDHPASYIKEQEIAARFHAMQSAYDANPVACGCGSEGTGALIRVRANPIALTRHGMWSPMLSCFKCYLGNGGSVRW